MRRCLLLAAVCALAFPRSATAQATLLAGVGITSPIRAFADQAESGYHARLGVEVGIPTLPVALRLDGSYHRLGAATAAVESPHVLGGALTVVFSLPGVGLTPYMLGGAGRFRLDSGPAGMSATSVDTGFEAGFGVNLGSLAFGAFAEIRYVQINRTGANADVKYVPLTVGLRL